MRLARRGLCPGRGPAWGAAPVAPIRLLALVVLIALTLSTGLIASIAWLTPSAQAAPPAVTAPLATPAPIAEELRSALGTDAGGTRRVELPDAWERSAPARNGALRYRLELPARALEASPAALFIPRAGPALRVQVNGVTLLDNVVASSAGASGERSRAETLALAGLVNGPLLLPLPAALLRLGTNVAEIEVIGGPGRDPGLSTVWVGPLAELAPRHRWQLRHEVQGTWVVSAAACVMGVLALLLAFRTRHGVYACFGAASLLWSWRVSGPPQADWGAWLPLGTVLFHASYAWFAVLMALYALAAASIDRPAARRVLLAWAVAALGLSVATWAFDAPAARTALLGGTLAIVCWITALLLDTAWRRRTLPPLLLGGAALVSLGVGLRDFWIFRVLHDYGAPTWSRYTILLLLAVLAWLLVDEFARSAAALGTLNRELQDRVALKEGELHRSFEATRESERQQAVLAERDRILREMHDGLGGRLVGAMALVAQVERQTAAPPDGATRGVDEPLRDLKLTLDDCLVELRIALDSLETDRPLIEALAALRFRVEPSLRAAGVRLVWQVDEAASMLELPAADTLHVLRIVREALTNVIKHAQATVVWLRLERVARVARVGQGESADEAGGGSGGVRLAVVDNGLPRRVGGSGGSGGFSGSGGPNSPGGPGAVSGAEQGALPLFVPALVGAGQAGRGLANMQRRAQALGARLDSGPHEDGWQVVLELAHGTPMSPGASASTPSAALAAAASAIPASSAASTASAA